jgi:hypothetical protein
MASPDARSKLRAYRIKRTTSAFSVSDERGEVSSFPTGHLVAELTSELSRLAAPMLTAQVVLLIL